MGPFRGPIGVYVEVEVPHYFSHELVKVCNINRAAEGQQRSDLAVGGYAVSIGGSAEAACSMGASAVAAAAAAAAAAACSGGCGGAAVAGGAGGVC